MKVHFVFYFGISIVFLFVSIHCKLITINRTLPSMQTSKDHLKDCSNFNETKDCIKEGKCLWYKKTCVYIDFLVPVNQCQFEKAQISPQFSTDLCQFYKIGFWVLLLALALMSLFLCLTITFCSSVFCPCFC